MAQLFDSAYYDASADAVAPDNAAILTDLYRTIFNREPDQSGFDFWLGALNQGYTPEFVRDQFLASPEYADIQAQKNTPAPTPASVEPAFDKYGFITGLYEQVLRRPPDQEGLNFWVDALDKGYSPDFIEQQFYSSPEYQQLINPTPAPAPASTPIDPLFAHPRYIEAKQLAQEYGAFPVTIGDTVYNVLADGAVETIKPTDSTMQGTSTGAELGLFSPTGEAIVAPYFDPSYGEKSIGDLIVNASLAAAVGGLVGPAGAGLLSTPAAAAVGSGFSTLGATGDYESAVKAAALAGLSAGAGEALGLTGGTTTGGYSAVEDAAQLAAQGIPEDQIFTILRESGVPFTEAVEAAFPSIAGETVTSAPTSVSTFPTLSAPSGLDQVQVTGGPLSSVSPLLESVSASLPTALLPTATPTPSPAPAPERVEVTQTKEPAVASTTPTLADVIPAFTAAPVATPVPAPAPVLPPAPVSSPAPTPATDQVQITETKAPVPAPAPAPIPEVFPGLFGSTVVPSPGSTPTPAPAPVADRVEVTETKAPAPSPSPAVDVVPGLLGSTVTTSPTPAPAPATDRVTVEGTKVTEPAADKPDALTPVYVPPTVDIPIPEVTTKPTLSNADIQNIIKLVGGLISGGAAGGTLMGGGGVGGVGSLPPSDTMIGSTTPQFGPDYYAAVQQYYNAYMPETPRNVVGPLQQWYENKFGA